MRYDIIDNFKGIAFILMIIHHIFYLYDITFYTNYSNNNIIALNQSGILDNTATLANINLWNYSRDLIVMYVMR